MAKGFCEDCGVALAPGKAFCGNCGAASSNADPAPYTETPPAVMNPVPQQVARTTASEPRKRIGLTTMVIAVTVLAAAALVYAMSGGSQAQPTAGEPLKAVRDSIESAEGAAEIAARVNGEAITVAELEAVVNPLVEQQPHKYEGAQGEVFLLDLKRQVLDNLINGVLARQAAAERGIVVTDEEIDAQVVELKAGFANEDDFNAALAEANLTVAALEQQLRNELATQRLMEELVGDEEITEAEIADYYRANADQYEEHAAIRSSHILFDLDDKDTAERVLREVKAGGDFGELARAYSTDPGSAAQGGDLGWSDPARPFVAEFQDGLDALAIGGVSELVETEFGWHIIRVDDTREGRAMAAQEISAEIREAVLQQRRAHARGELIEELRARAQIEIYVEGL